MDFDVSAIFLGVLLIVGGGYLQNINKPPFFTNCYP